ncbi:MAG: antitoxin [Candidatus Aminicenantes bacterium]|nr:antitoxin [Candidatus Aminicenantes bacterium]
MENKKKFKDKKAIIDALESGKIGLIDDPDEEKEILEAYERGELIPVDDGEKKKRELIEAVWNTAPKTKRISIRLTEQDLERLRMRASEVGIPYQTIIGSLVHQYASGKLTVHL